MEQVNLFNDEFKNIRMELVDGEPWYSFKNICREFDSDYPENNYDKIYDNLPNDQKGFLLIDNLDNKFKILTVNAKAIPTLLLILGSDNDKSKKFNDWIYYQVVPTIVETGTYIDNENIIDKFNLYQKN
jgi:prophage antirepressor-like protein